MLEKIKQYLDQLNERERRAVIAAAVALALFIPYQFIWAPFKHNMNELENRVEQQQKDLLWMQDRVSEARELARAAGGTTGSAQPVYGLIESTARQRFGGDIRVQQEGKGGVRVTMKNIGFDDIMLWLDDLYYKQHVNIKEFTVDRQTGAGRVNANILIES
jgi:type II secretory pathway component PulM